MNAHSHVYTLRLHSNRNGVSIVWSIPELCVEPDVFCRWDMHGASNDRTWISFFNSLYTSKFASRLTWSVLYVWSQSICISVNMNCPLQYTCTCMCSIAKYPHVMLWFSCNLSNVVNFIHQLIVYLYSYIFREKTAISWRRL
jgi:hypothetical protein